MGGKSGSSSNDYYGHAGGIVCQGQLDFTWGFMVSNVLVWPTATLWDSQVYQQGKTYVVSGSVYRALAKTEVDPPNAPWALIAVPWSAGTFTSSQNTLYLGNLFEAVATTTATPPATAVSTSDWQYVSTPPVFG